MSEATITHVNADDIRKMTDMEGLVLQGCGGDPKEWVDGINETLTHEEILRDGDAFKEIYVFQHDGHTNILFSMEDVSLDIGRLAMWRLRNHSTFGGTWLSDYLPNRLGVNTDIVQTKPNKPEMQLLGMDGNIFAVLGNASRLLKRNGMGDQAKEMMERAQAAGSYEQALMIVSEYVQTELSQPEQVREPEPVPKRDYETHGFERLYKTILRDESMPRANLESTLYNWYMTAPTGEYHMDNEAAFIDRLKQSDAQPYSSLTQTCRSLYCLEVSMFDALDGDKSTGEVLQADALYTTYCQLYKEQFGIEVNSPLSSWKLCDISLEPTIEIAAEFDHGYIARLDNTGPKHVYICAPLRNDVERNIEAARLYAKDVFEQGNIPICPHLIFPPIADPSNPEQDKKALNMCMKLIEGCHQVNVYGTPTEGMQTEITHAKRMGIPVHESAPAKKKTQGKTSQHRSPGR